MAPAYLKDLDLHNRYATIDKPARNSTVKCEKLFIIALMKKVSIRE